MNRKSILYFLLAAYIIGNLLLIFIQYNWAKNFDTLIEGNQKLVEEFSFSGRVKELERDVLSVESRIRGTISTNDTVFIVGLEADIVDARNSIRQLRTVLAEDSIASDINTLESLVNDKLLYSRRLLETYHTQGKAAAENLIATQQGKRLTDSILLLTRNMETVRQQELTAVTATINTSGANALRLGIILIASVLVSGAFGFWYVINTIRRQQGLIRQLHLSQKKERESARVKENFMANMSHEIRTPMNAILGFTNLLQRRPNLDAESKQYIQTIQRSGESLLTIINDILDLSKIEAGMMRIESAPFSLRGLLHSLETMFRPRASEKGLDLETVIDGQLPDVLEGDAVRLTQVLVNLAGNAVKFTNEGHIRITVEKKAQQDNQLEIGFTVADTGIGIAKEKLATIFDRFQQAEGSVTRRYGGTGLGLSIARDLIKLQNGTIAVESEPGKGTRFYFTLHYRLTPALSKTETQSTQLPASDSQLQNLSVLVVEDNQINQSLLTIILRQWGVKSEIANNGREALDKLQQQQFHLVLMDIQMPEMDGYTATQKIRAEMQSAVPIVAMTAHAMAGEREKCLSYGMNDYLSKPVREEQLYQVLLRFAKVAGASGPVPKDGPLPTISEYRYIDLGYMREISGGDASYEKLVTEQFLELLPADLAGIETAWQQGDTATVRRLAHNLKTTISVMGLNKLLHPYLNALEYEQLTNEDFQQGFAALQQLSEAAMVEARTFYASLT
jgi:signal transduction histidine kinase/ActR/RegA family two-component response regulator/uncharacterized protein YihD (DUF1040 family)